MCEINETRMPLLRTHIKASAENAVWDQRKKQGFKEAVDPSFSCTELSSKAWRSKELIMLT